MIQRTKRCCDKQTHGHIKTLLGYRTTDALKEATRANTPDRQRRLAHWLKLDPTSLSIDEKRVDNMRAWTDAQLANYETALETIGNVIAITSRDIADEREKIRPDADRINELLALQRRLNHKRQRLRIHDEAAVRNATEIYSKIVRAGRL